MGDELVALGGAFLAAGILARMGRRIGLPTIPFFMLAGIIFGPNTPGIALVDDPHELELLAALGLILLLFHLGLEFSIGDLLAGGRSLLAIGAIYLAAEHRRRPRLRVRAGLGFARGVGDRGSDRHLVLGDRHQTAHRAAPPRQSREPAHPRHHRRRGRVPRALPRAAPTRPRQGRQRARRDRAVRDRGSRSCS